MAAGGFAQGAVIVAGEAHVHTHPSCVAASRRSRCLLWPLDCADSVACRVPTFYSFLPTVEVLIVACAVMLGRLKQNDSVVRAWWGPV